MSQQISHSLQTLHLHSQFLSIFLPCELTKGKFSIKSYFWWLVFIPKADNDRQVLLVGLGKPELTTLLDPLPSGTHFPRQYHQPLKAKSVHILQPDIYTSTRLRIVIQQTWFDATLVYRFNECNRRVVIILELSHPIVWLVSSYFLTPIYTSSEKKAANS